MKKQEKTQTPWIKILTISALIIILLVISIVGATMQFQALLVKKSVTERQAIISNPQTEKVDQVEENKEEEKKQEDGNTTISGGTDNQEDENNTLETDRTLENACIDLRTSLGCTDVLVCSATECHCSTGGGTTGTGVCTTNVDCSGTTPLCKATNGSCVECLQNTDCSANETCTNNQCSVSTTGTGSTSSITGNLVISANDAVYDVLSPTQSTYSNTSRGPQMSGMVLDPKNLVAYVNDHIGVYSFKFNKLNDANVTPIELASSPRYDSNGRNQACLIKADEGYVSKCVAYGGDTGGYQSPRAYGPIAVDEHQVLVYLHHLTTHPYSILMFSDDSGTMRLESEFIPESSMYGDNPQFGAVSREGGGVAFLGGLDSLRKGSFLMLFAPGQERYVLYSEGSTSSTYVNISQVKLARITNALNSEDLGSLSMHPELDKIIRSTCRKSTLNDYSYSCNFLKENSAQEKRAVVKENNEFILYDFTNPTQITEIDRWSAAGSTMSFSGLVDNEVATISNDVLYVHYASVNDNISSSPLLNLNPKKLNKCWYDSKYDVRPCYYGQVWKHEIGSASGWQKVMDVPSTKADIYDGKLFLFGYMFDESTLYNHKYGTRTYQSNITDTRRMWIYDLENGSWSMKAEPYSPEGCKFVSYAATEQNDKYYVYAALKDCGQEGVNNKTYIWGYEITQCSGSSCTSVTNPDTTCMPSCTGQACGASDGCGGYCNNDNSCQAGFSCLPRHYDSSTTQPRCMCPYGSQYLNASNDQCTPGAERLIVNGASADGRCGIQPQRCDGVIGCSHWTHGTSYMGLYWREQLEAMNKPVEGIEQCAYQNPQ